MVSQVRVLFGAPITKHHPNGWCFVVSELKRTRRTSGTEQQSGGLLRPRATKRPQARESSPVWGAIRKAMKTLMCKDVSFYLGFEKRIFFIKNLVKTAFALLENNETNI